MGASNLSYFYGQWLLRTWARPLLYVDTLAGVLALSGGAVVFFYPDWRGTLTELLWMIPLPILVLCVVIGFFRAPYSIYQDVIKNFYKIRAAMKEGVLCRLSETLSSLEDDIASSTYKANQKKAIWKNKHGLIVHDLRRIEHVENSAGESDFASLSSLIDKPTSSIETTFAEYVREVRRLAGLLDLAEGSK